MTLKRKYPSLKRLIILLIILCSMVSAGCTQQQEVVPERPAPEVGVVTAAEKPLVLTTGLSGRTAAFLVSEIRPQVNGLIQKKVFEEGSNVEKGQTLYEIDSAPYRAALESALANLSVAVESANRAESLLNAGIAEVARQNATLALALKNQTRFDELIKVKAVSESQLDQAVTQAEVARASVKAAEAQVASHRDAVAVSKASIQMAEAALETARINLAYCRVTAPISGRIGKSNVTEGAIVTAYQPVPLATIQQLDPIYVDLPQSTAELQRLKAGMSNEDFGQEADPKERVTLLLENGQTYPYKGTVKFQDVTVDPTTGSVVLRVVIPNPDHVLLPGMFVQAVIEEGTHNHAILIPQQSVRRDHRGNPFVLLAGKEDVVEPRPVTLDRAIGSEWFVSSGLAPGDRVIAEGLLKIRPGVKVRVVPFGADTPKPAPDSGQGPKAAGSSTGGA